MPENSELNQIVDGVAAAVSADVANAAAVFRAEGASGRGQGVASEIRAGRHRFTVDEPPALGGRDTAPNPVEFALASLISCQVVVYRFWAERLGIELDDVSVRAEGDLDVRGIFGLQDGVRAGFSQVRLDVTLTGPETEERYAELQRTVDEHCPVLDLFSNPTEVATTLAVGATA